MRRLPIFFLLDCSESMVGEKIIQMEDCLKNLVHLLRKDPYSLETVHISIIAFAGKAETIVPLIDLVSFYTPKLPLGSGTNLSSALIALMDEIDKSLIPTTFDKKGDWKPIVYLLTDGRPTDDFDSTLEQWKRYYGKADVVAVSIGHDADISILNKITRNVFQLDNFDNESQLQFIRWISNSISFQSKNIGDFNHSSSFLISESSLIKAANEFKGTDHVSCVSLVGRCTKYKKPYLIKYENKAVKLSNVEFEIPLLSYSLSGCYQIDESFFEWSSNDNLNLTVNTSELHGTPSCPHCGSSTAFAVCSCGKLMCLNEPGIVVCPWCEKNVSFEARISQDDTGFNVSRGLG